MPNDNDSKAKADSPAPPPLTREEILNRLMQILSHDIGQTMAVTRTKVWPAGTNPTQLMATLALSNQVTIMRVLQEVMVELREITGFLDIATGGQFSESGGGGMTEQ